MSDTTKFQICQKLIVFNENYSEVLLAKRKGEADFDNMFSFIGGKLETTDGGIVDGLKREKDEEVGVNVQLSVYPLISYNEYYVKKDGNAMILPHYFAVYLGGEIILSDEYSEYKWVKIRDLAKFQPKIHTIEPAIERILIIKNLVDEHDMVII